MGKFWTEKEINFLKKNYAQKSNKELSELLGRKSAYIFSKAFALGLKKDKAYLSASFKQRYLNGELDYLKKTQFNAEHTPFNKGRKWDEYLTEQAKERMRTSTFKKGNKPHNAYKEEFGVISIRPNDGKDYQYIKLENAKWVPYHRYVWEMNYGPIPKGMSVYFKDRNTMNTSLDNLVLLDRNQLLQMNRQLIKENGKEALRMKKINESRAKNRLEALRNTPVIKSNYAITGKKPLVLDDKTIIYIDAHKDPQKVLETYRNRNLLSNF